MRIGIDCRLFSPSFGIGRYSYELVSHLSKLPTSHTFVLFCNEPELLQRYVSSPSFEIVPVGAKHYSLAEQTKFLRILRKAKLDLMHFTHFNAPLHYSGKSVVTIHDLTLHFSKGKKMKSVLHRLAYLLVIRAVTKKAAHIIAISQKTKEDIVTELNVPEEKVSIIYEAAGREFRPMDDLGDLTTRYGVTKPLLLYTGNWRSHKNVVRLVEAFAVLRNTHGYDAQLMLTGKTDTVYAKEVLGMIKQLGLEEHVLLPGIVPEEDLVPLYNLAHVFVFPSLYEGFGLPPLEAMACGTVTALSNTSCIPEVCGNGSSFYFDPLDVSDMARVIYRACTDEAERISTKERGLEQVSHYSWGAMAESTLDLYEQVLGL